MEVVLWSLASVLVVSGVAGLVVPLVPGPILVFAGLFLGAWAGNFHEVGWMVLSVLAVMAIAASFIDGVFTLFGVKLTGGSKWAMAGAALGGLIGFFFSFVGVLVGPFIGAFVVELMVQRNAAQAGTAAAGVWLGMALGFAVRAALTVSMIGVFVLFQIF